jgi:hypothetical protein
MSHASGNPYQTAPNNIPGVFGINAVNKVTTIPPATEEVRYLASNGFHLVLTTGGYFIRLSNTRSGVFNLHRAVLKERVIFIPDLAFEPEATDYAWF